jgi:hypothetical protein
LFYTRKDGILILSTRETSDMQLVKHSLLRTY